MTLTICFIIDSVEFTPGVIDGSESLGGSESAAVGVARALQARGHRVFIFSTKLSEDAPAFDQAGVRWCPLSALRTWSEVATWDVAIAVRMPVYLTMPTLRSAGLRVLWNQDLIAGEDMKQGIMAAAAFDRSVYVSEYHRQQWEDLLPELRPFGWTSRNGFDPSLVPTGVTKDPNRIIHISRPERGLDAILKMWPQVRAQHDRATLQVCRYSSMYDEGGWGRVCREYDAKLDALNAEVGGIERLGELGKSELYRAIASAAVMWYPGVVDFGETSCIAAIEAQACGTPFVGSFKGALPETVPAGVLVAGDAVRDAVYHETSVAAVLEMLDGCARSSVAYRKRVDAGRSHVHPRYTFEVIAAEVDEWLTEQFAARYAAEKPRMLARMLHEDDHVTARVIADELDDQSAVDFCDYIIAGKDHTAEQYGAHALDPLSELAMSEAPDSRINQVVGRLAPSTRVVDVACGNGAFSIALALARPDRVVVGIDYSAQNIEAARQAAALKGVADRCTFICEPAWDYDTQQPSAWMREFATAHARSFDGLFCGEFLEHVANATGLIETLNGLVSEGGPVVWTCPFGPLGELIDRNQPHDRGHVHHFRSDDLDALFGGQSHYTLSALPWQGETPRGHTTGNWLVWYRCAPSATAAPRPLDRRILRRPFRRITAGLIVNDTVDLRRCLRDVWPVVDEIVIGDCGADAADLARVVEEFPRKTRVVPVGRVPDLPGGFSEARNVVLDAATGDDFLWIDADEVLFGGSQLAARVDWPVFKGYAIPQQNMHIDAPMSTEHPIRLFRREPSIRFYGCIHEQPQDGDCNGEIAPSLRIDDIQIAHHGYLTEGQRRAKAYHRNLPLLIRDQEQFPDRELGKLLVMRDHANIAIWEREKAGGRVTAAVRERLAMVVGIYEKFFSAPTHRYHALGRPYYDMALREVKGAVEVEMGVIARQHGLPDDVHAKRERFWVRQPEDIPALVSAHLDQVVAPMQVAKRLAVEPVTGTPAAHPGPLVAAGG